jgi:hypothetical protein
MKQHKQKSRQRTSETGINPVNPLNCSGENLDGALQSKFSIDQGNYAKLRREQDGHRRNNSTSLEKLRLSYFFKNPKFEKTSNKESCQDYSLNCENLSCDQFKNKSCHIVVKRNVSTDKDALPQPFMAAKGANLTLGSDSIQDFRDNKLSRILSKLTVNSSGTDRDFFLKIIKKGNQNNISHDLQARGGHFSNINKEEHSPCNMASHFEGRGRTMTATNENGSFSHQSQKEGSFLKHTAVSSPFEKENQTISIASEKEIRKSVQSEPSVCVIEEKSQDTNPSSSVNSQNVYEWKVISGIKQGNSNIKRMSKPPTGLVDKEKLMVGGLGTQIEMEEFFKKNIYYMPNEKKTKHCLRVPGTQIEEFKKRNSSERDSSGQRGLIDELQFFLEESFSKAKEVSAINSSNIRLEDEKEFFEGLTKEDQRVSVMDLTHDLSLEIRKSEGGGRHHQKSPNQPSVPLDLKQRNIAEPLKDLNNCDRALKLNKLKETDKKLRKVLAILENERLAASRSGKELIFYIYRINNL